EAANAVLDLTHDPQPGIASLVRSFPHLAVDLGRENHFVSAILQGLADDLFRAALAVHVGGVDEIDAGVERLVDHADAFVFVGVAPRAEHHGPETQRAYLHTGSSKRSVLHVTSFLSTIAPTHKHESQLLL